MDTHQTLWIPLVLPNLNDLIGAAKAHWSVYGKMKVRWGQVVALYARTQGFKPIEVSSHFEYEFHEKSRRRDPSNIAAGGIKIMEDALQEAGLLKNDGWKHVASFAVTWKVAAPQGVLLTVRRSP